jgi:hypothetical protein
MNSHSDSKGPIQQSMQDAIDDQRAYAWIEGSGNVGASICGYIMSRGCVSVCTAFQCFFMLPVSCCGLLMFCCGVSGWNRDLLDQSIQCQLEIGVELPARCGSEIGSEVGGRLGYYTGQFFGLSCVPCAVFFKNPCETVNKTLMKERIKQIDVSQAIHNACEPIMSNIDNRLETGLHYKPVHKGIR